MYTEVIADFIQSDSTVLIESNDVLHPYPVGHKAIWYKGSDGTDDTDDTDGGNLVRCWCGLIIGIEYSNEDLLELRPNSDHNVGALSQY